MTLILSARSVRSGLYDDVISSVKSVRSAAIEGMRRIRRKAAAGLQDGKL